MHNNHLRLVPNTVSFMRMALFVALVKHGIYGCQTKMAYHFRKILVFCIAIWIAISGLLGSVHNAGLEALGPVPVAPGLNITMIADRLSQFYALAADMVGARAASFQITSFAAFCAITAFLIGRLLRDLWRVSTAGQLPIFGSLENGILAIFLIGGLMTFTYPVFEARAARGHKGIVSGKEFAISVKSSIPAMPVRTQQDQQEAKSPESYSTPYTDIKYRLTEADPRRGARRIAVCTACHSFEKDGPVLAGANLWNIVGRDIASAQGVYYSPALQRLDGVWTVERLDLFLNNSARYVPGTAMIINIENDKVRADIIAFLIDNAD